MSLFSVQAIANDSRPLVLSQVLKAAFGQFGGCLEVNHDGRRWMFRTAERCFDDESLHRQVPQQRGNSFSTPGISLMDLQEETANF